MILSILLSRLHGRKYYSLCVLKNRSSQHCVRITTRGKAKSYIAEMLVSSVWVMIVMDSVISLFKTCVFVVTSLASTRLHVTFSLF